MQSHKMTESFPEIELKIEIEEIQELKENAENINTKKKTAEKPGSPCGLKKARVL